MKLKELVELLSDVPEFESPSYELEQYKTSAEVAADITFSVERSYGDISGRCVLDLGCGTGIFTVASAALGAAIVVGVDVDESAISCAQDALFDGARADFILADVINGSSPLRGSFVVAGSAGADAEAVAGEEDSLGEGAHAGGSLRAAVSASDGVFDTAILNPPFGTRRAGADVAFLRAAMCGVTRGRGVAYSLHKSSTRAHLARLISAAGVGVALVAQIRFPVPATYAFHRDAERDIDVDLLRLVRGPPKAVSAARADAVPPYQKLGEDKHRRGRGERGGSGRRR
jgi:predicted RNA methylase